MITLYICRHGQTENNKYQRLSGWIDTPLTAEGAQNAISSANKLAGKQFFKIVSSDLGRAFVTAYLIARKLGHADEIERLAGLREVNYGDLANMSIAEVTAGSYPLSDSHYIPSHGESLAQMQLRVMACIDKLSHDYAGKTILLVSHDGTINALYASYARLDIGQVDASRTNAHDFVAQLSYDKGQITSFEEITT